MRMNPHMLQTIAPPIVEAQRWLERPTRDLSRPLLNLSQAAPVGLPALSLRKHIAEFLMKETAAHAYGPVLGNQDLREAIAELWTELYGGDIAASQVALTSGCNQAFTAAVTALAKAGEAVMLCSPMYFNHRMWLDMLGIEARMLEVDESMQPSPEQASRLIDDRLRAIVLVTPNNPTGAEYPPALLREFYVLARRNGLALIVDETYRDFVRDPDSLHKLFQEPRWERTLVHLYSFSKAYRLTGHRLGAVVASPDLLFEIEKYMDTVAICANQIAQRAAVFAIRHLQPWLDQERARISRRRRAVESGFAQMQEWTLRGCGAYFAYVRHPFDVPSDEVVLQLLDQQNMLMLPDTLFASRESSREGVEFGRHLRIAFANVGVSDIRQFFVRLNEFRLPQA
ncbi:MAG: aminotransferase [Rhodobacteraceae bacterium]|nr:aminotransferase [Paracoccaceae bacterium]